MDRLLSLRAFGLVESAIDEIVWLAAGMSFEWNKNS